MRYHQEDMQLHIWPPLDARFSHVSQFETLPKLAAASQSNAV
jgi:hypothetical protein